MTNQKIRENINNYENKYDDHVYMYKVIIEKYKPILRLKNGRKEYEYDCMEDMEGFNDYDAALDFYHYKKLNQEDNQVIVLKKLIDIIDHDEITKDVYKSYPKGSKEKRSFSYVK